MAKKNKLPKYDLFHLFTKYNVAFFDDWKEWNKSMDIDNNGEDKIKKDSIGRAGIFELKDGVAFGIFVNKEHYHYRHIIHETTHIIDFLMDYVGISDIEFRAYMIEDLSVRLIEHCRVKYEK